MNYIDKCPEPKPMVTAEAAVNAMIAAWKLLEPEPIGEWMRAQGRPPETWGVVLPSELKPNPEPAFLPHYVIFSEAVAAPVFVPRPWPTWMPSPEDW